MRKVIHKLFWVWNFDKEEKWLNEMAAKGFALVGVGFCRYEFEECEPGEYEIKLQLLGNRPCSPESQHYISFVEETGAEQVGSFNLWVYFRKKKSEGGFELFSDLDSRIKHLRRMIIMIAALSAANLCIGISNILMFFFWDSTMNIGGFINLAIALLGFAGTWRLVRKSRNLKSERRIFE
ncbi:MAG: DUF2812 domain-containing protein [Ruminococcus sp.]